MAGLPQSFVRKTKQAAFGPCDRLTLVKTVGSGASLTLLHAVLSVTYGKFLTFLVPQKLGIHKRKMVIISTLKGPSQE